MYPLDPKSPGINPAITEVKNPYVATKGGVLFRYMIGNKIHFKPVCGRCSSNDAKVIAKLLNQNYNKI